MGEAGRSSSRAVFREQATKDHAPQVVSFQTLEGPQGRERSEVNGGIREALLPEVPDYFEYSGERAQESWLCGSRQVVSA